MDIIPNKHDQLILRLAYLSPLVKHILQREQYRLRLETDDVNSESVLQECIIALRDDLAAIGLYFTCQLSEFYVNLDLFSQCLDVFAYILPNSFYPKIQQDHRIAQLLKTIVEGAVGNESTLLIFLRWLGSGEDCYDPTCTPGAHWLVDNLINTDLFDIYLKKLTEVDLSLNVAESIPADEIQLYIKHIQQQAYLANDTLVKITDVLQVESTYQLLQRRFDMYYRALLQPDKLANNVWLRLTDVTSLSEGMLALHKQRWLEYTTSNKLYGQYYHVNNIIPNEIDITGVVVRYYSEHPYTTRNVFIKELRDEFTISTAEAFSFNLLLTKIVNAAYTDFT